MLPLRAPGALLTFGCGLGLYLPLALLEWSARYPDFRLIVLLFVPLPIATACSVLQLHAWAHLRHLAHGHSQPIAQIEAQHISPWRNPQAIQVGLLVLPMAGLVAAVLERSVPGGICLAVMVAAILPALVGIVVLEEPMLEAVRPRRLLQFIAGLGIAYVPFSLAVALGVAALALGTLVAKPTSLAVLLAASYCFVLGHAAAGRVLYTARDRIGLATIDGATPVDLAGALVAAQIDDLMVELHRDCMAGRPRRAALQLDAYLAGSDYSLDEHVHQRLQHFLDQRLFVAHADSYASRLIEAGRPLPAWLVLRQALHADAHFRPASLDVLLAAIEHAPTHDAPHAIDFLLDIESTYTAHELVPDALLCLARCHERQSGDAQAVLALLARIEAQHPRFAAEPAYRDAADRMRKRARVS